MVVSAMYLGARLAALVPPVTLVLHVTLHHVPLNHASIMAYALYLAQRFRAIVRLDIPGLHAKPVFVTKFLAIPCLPDLITVLSKNVAITEIVR